MPTIAGRGAAAWLSWSRWLPLSPAGAAAGPRPATPRPILPRPRAWNSSRPPRCSRLPPRPQGRQSVHVTGTAINNGKPVRVDLRIQSNASSGTMELHGVKLEFITTGGTTYLKADQQTWATLGVPAVAGRLADRWVKTGPRQLAGLTGFSLDNLAGQLMRVTAPGPTVERTTLDGTKVVVISRKDGSKLYVANTGPPYPLRGRREGGQRRADRLHRVRRRLPHHRTRQRHGHRPGRVAAASPARPGTIGTRLAQIGHHHCSSPPIVWCGRLRGAGRTALLSRSPTVTSSRSAVALS